MKVYNYQELPTKIRTKLFLWLMFVADSKYDSTYITSCCISIPQWIEGLKEIGIYNDEMEAELFVLSMSDK